MDHDQLSPVVSHSRAGILHHRQIQGRETTIVGIVPRKLHPICQDQADLGLEHMGNSICQERTFLELRLAWREWFQLASIAS